MKARYLVNIAYFVAGAVCYLIVSTTFFESSKLYFESQTTKVKQMGLNQNLYKVSDPYFKEKLGDVCVNLEENACGCRIFVQTNLSCKSQLNEIVDEKSRKYREAIERDIEKMANEVRAKG